MSHFAFRFAETRRPHASLPTVFKVQPHTLVLWWKPWKRCCDYRWLMASRCVPVGLYTARGTGGVSHVSDPIVARQWSLLRSALTTFLHFCRTPPPLSSSTPSPIVALNCRVGVVVTFFSFTVIQWTWTLLPATCEPQHPKSSGRWLCDVCCRVRRSTLISEGLIFGKMKRNDGKVDWNERKSVLFGLVWVSNSNALFLNIT